MNKSLLNYMTRHISELLDGQKLTAYGMTFWANVARREIYGHSRAADMSGVINGYKLADISDDWETVTGV